jgi:dihydroxyacetone kinase DhaKLM complex PTS-EIIA-like component DhaM
MANAEHGEGLVGLVIVSHVAALAEGVAAFATMQADRVRVVPAGGITDPGTGTIEIGTDAMRIAAAIREADDGAGVVVLGDLLGAFIAIETAIADILPAEDPDLAARVRVSGGPLVEGAYFAAMQANIGDSLDEVLENAEAAAALVKIER